MRLAIYPLILLALTSCVSAAADGHEALMDEIEASVVLPTGALPLKGYARYYTEYRGAIHGAYTTHIEKRSADYGCSEMTEDLKLKEVTCPAIADLEPGNRRWVKFRDYPAVSGQHCSAIQIMFNPKTKAFDWVACSEPTY